MNTSRFAVLGAGNGGLTMAAHLALKGFEVALWNRTPDRIEPIRQSQAVQIITDRDDLPNGRAHLTLVTADLAEAVHDAQLIMVVVPATGHKDIAASLAEHLVDGQMVVLHPGRTGGALEFLQQLRTHGLTADVIVAEAQTLLYACRALNPGQVKLFGIKNSVPVAAIPAHQTTEVIRALSVAFEEFVPGDNVMKTSLDNIGAIFHPAVTVLNAGRIETTRGDFEYYIDGISRSVSLVLESLDAERVKVSRALGFNCLSAREWLYIAYGAAGKTLFDAIRSNEGYYGIKAPTVIQHRYIEEDIPTSLVPIASLGRQVGVPCPTMDTIIHLANLMHGCDYWKTGRTVESMGLANLTLREIRMAVLEGLPMPAREAV